MDLTPKPKSIPCLAFGGRLSLFFFLSYLHHAAAISGDYNEVSVEAGQEASALA